MKSKSFLHYFCFSLLVILLIYGGGRLYFALTGGFTLGNITSTLPYNPKLEVRDNNQYKHLLENILNQEFTYLGKGCQSYVFASQDGQYVIKFFKFQRFRPQAWIYAFDFIPFVNSYQQQKILEKQEKLNRLFTSVMLAYKNLPEETGLVFVHLNKTPRWNPTLTIRDKIGLTHQVHLGETEFIVQKRAQLMCDTISSYMEKGNEGQVQVLVDNLFYMLLGEYAQGIADNDHALMQNTGVYQGKPIHIDVGQFIYNPIVSNPEVYRQEIYDKTYKLHKWLQERYPNVALHLRTLLVNLIGINYYYMGPYVHKGDVAKIKHITP